MEQSYWSSAINWMQRLLDEEFKINSSQFELTFTWHSGGKEIQWVWTSVDLVSGFEDIRLLLVLGLFLFYPR
jgi:hypothetical protein